MSKKVILYIATSLDGFIARENGSVDWLPDSAEDFGYEAFLSQIDTVLMGHKTYRQILTFDMEYPYSGKRNYVFTRDKTLERDEHVEFVHSNIIPFVKALKVTGFKHIWLVGGGELFSELLAAGIVDELILFVFPLVLGEGIPLFQGPFPEQKLELLYAKSHQGGVVELKYGRHLDDEA